MAGSPRATGCARCREPTSSASRQTGSPSPGRSEPGGDGQHPLHERGPHQLGLHRGRRPSWHRARPALHRPEFSSSPIPAGPSPGRRAGPRRRSSTPTATSPTRGASGTGTSTTKSCETGVPISTTRCWAPAQSRAGTEQHRGRRRKTMVKVTLRKDGVTRRTVLGALAPVGAAAVAMPWTVRHAWAADPIRFGVISPLTGAWTVYGKAHFSGFELRSRRSTGPAACSAGRSRSSSATARPSRGSSSSRRTAWSARSGSTSWPAPSPRPSATPRARWSNRRASSSSTPPGTKARARIFPRRVQQEHLHVRSRAVAAGLAVHRLYHEESWQEVLPDRLGLRLASRDEQDVQGEIQRAGRPGRRRGLHPLQHAAVRFGAA